MPKVLTALLQFVKTLNIYIKENGEKVKFVVLQSGDSYLRYMFNCMGMDYTTGGSSQEKEQNQLV